MSYTYVLKLDVPEGRQSEDLIQRYAAFVNMRRMYFDIYLYPRSKFVIDDYRDHGEVQIMETVSGEIFDEIPKTVFENLSIKNTKKHRFDSQDIFIFTEKLREAADRLDKQYPERNWILTVELNLIPILEFAICNGFEVVGEISK